MALAPSAQPLAGQGRATPPQAFPAELDRYLANVVVAWEIPGLAIAVVRNDSTLVAKGYGVRTLGGPDSVTEHTVFDIASLTKSFTATAAAILVDEGRLGWDDLVRRHVPDLVLPSDDLTARATVRDFLAHRTGLEAANMMWVMTAVDRAEVLRRVRHLKVMAPLRERMIYSNVGYTVAGAAAAAAAGMTFEALLESRLIGPLGLTSTTSSYGRAEHLPNVASAHATLGGRQQPIRRETQRGATAPAGAVQSTVTDMARWMRLHLNDGVLDGVRYVSAAAMREMHAIQVPIPTTAAMRAARMVEDTVVGYGMGWNVMDYRGHPMLWHSGNGDGQIAYMAILPRNRLGVVVLVNTWSAPFVHGALANRILDTYLGYEAWDWAGEALARVPSMTAAADSARAALYAGADTSGVPRGLAAYAGRYEEPLFGPIVIGVEGSGLVLRMGDGQQADLDHHHADAFLVRWRDPLYRENFETLLTFGTTGDAVTSLRVRINRDELTATRAELARPAAGDVLLEGLTIVDPSRAFSSTLSSVLIRDGRIVEMYPTGGKAPPRDVQVLDLTGRYAIPGLVDAHVHLTSPFERAGQQDSLSRFFLMSGITAIRDMAGDGHVLRERAAAAQSGEVLSPRIYYSAVIASPSFFATDRRAASVAHGGVAGEVPWARSVASDSDAVAAARGAAEAGATGLKVYAELTAELLAAVTRAAHARGLRVWSHAAVAPARPRDAVAAGVDVLSHAFMLVLEDLDTLPPTYGAALDAIDFAGHPVSRPAFQRLLTDMGRRGTMLDATLAVSRRLATDRRIASGEWGNLRGVDRWAIDATRGAHAAGVRLVAGTDVSGYPGRDPLALLHDELAIYVDEVGLSPMDALATATVNAARALGAEEDIGSLAPGRFGDLVILDANPLDDIRNTRNISYVVKGGVVHPVAAQSLPWRPSWPGTEMALVSGDPFGTGPFVFRFRMPNGYWICPHRHPVDARIRTVSGTLLLGMGAVLDPAAARAVPPGSEVELSATMAHFEGAHGLTVIEVRGTGPWGITFLDPATDPGRSGSCRTP